MANLDLTAKVVNIIINNRGNHRPILWLLTVNNATDSLGTMDLTGYSARLLAYADCDLTIQVWNKTTANGGLSLVTQPSKTFDIDSVRTVIVNPWGVQVNMNLTDSNDVWAAADEGLHYLLFLTPPVGDELPLMAKGMLTAKGVC